MTRTPTPTALQPERNGAPAPLPSVPSDAPLQFTHRQILAAFSGLMTGMFLAALDQTIVSVALPTIVGELGGLEHLSWVVTAYLLTSTASVPLYGKLSDIFGRRSMFQTAIVLFLAGSLLAGVSQSMLQLILFRGLQGLGAGGLISLVMVIVGDLIPPRNRGRYQGYIGAVFALTSVSGPLLGGFLVDQLSWRWIFYVNLPFGILALVLTSITLKLPVPHIKHHVDYLGAFLLVAAVSCFLLFAVWGGTQYAWDGPTVWALFATGVLFTILFILQERVASEPILPLRLFKDPIVTVSVLVTIAIGAGMLGGTVFLPVFLQAVRGVSATDSGLLMLPMMMGVVIASVGGGRIISNTGKYRPWPIAGTAVSAVAFLLLATVQPDTSELLMGLYMGLIGLGIGMAMQPLVLAVQNTVRRRDLGSGTSLVNFSRSVGGTLAVAAFGAIFNNTLSRELARRLPPGAGSAGGSVLGTPEAIHNLPPGVRGPILDSLAVALHAVFLAALPIMLVAFALSWFLKGRPLRDTLHDAEAQPSKALAGTSPSIGPEAAAQQPVLAMPEL